jgi:hypothetical protein
MNSKAILKKTPLNNVFKNGILLGLLWWIWLTVGVVAQQTQQNFSVMQAENSAELLQPERYHSTVPLLCLGLLLLGILLLVGLQAYKQLFRSSSFPQKFLGQLRQERQRLFRELARLDDLFVQKKIEEKRYVVERERYKRQLIELTRLCELSDHRETSRS